jgi:thiamine-monophosphate kinase
VRKLSQIGEFGYLKRLLPRLYWPASLRKQLVIGPGDDAGVVSWKGDTVLVATTDTLVEGTHFERRWQSPEDLGYKAMAVNLSDLAAMGAVIPIGALITAGLPGDTSVNYVDKLYKGLENCAKMWKTGFLGGDTIRSRQLLVSVTLFGAARPNELIRRGGAHPGDIIMATGSFGNARAGMEILRKGLHKERWETPLFKAFQRPNPKLSQGMLLGRKRWATSMIDSSDGLKASVRLIAKASGTGARIDLDRVPVSRALARWAAKSRFSIWEYVLNGGEEYELVFTVPKRLVGLVQKNIGAAVIGEILPKAEGCWAVLGGKKIPLKDYGYRHF